MEAAESQGRGARVWVAALVALGLVGVGYQGWQETKRMKPVSAGKAATDFRLRRVDGKGDVVLSDHRGKVVMLDFWATWCRPCVEEMPVLTKLAKEYESRGLVFVAANRDDSATAEQDVRMFVGQVAPELLSYAAYADDFVSDRYQLRVLPTLYFIGRDGQVLESHLGAASEAQLRRWIERALAAKGSSAATP